MARDKDSMTKGFLDHTYDIDSIEDYRQAVHDIAEKVSEKIEKEGWEPDEGHAQDFLDDLVKQSPWIEDDDDLQAHAFAIAFSVQYEYAEERVEPGQDLDDIIMVTAFFMMRKDVEDVLAEGD